MTNYVINNPPYPTSDIKLVAILDQLQLLRDWIVGEREEMNAAALRLFANPKARKTGRRERPLIPPEPNLPRILDLETFTNQVMLATLTLVYGHMRKLREDWDQYVRVYEAEWTSDRALHSRIHCVVGGLQLLRTAFASVETLEHEQEQRSKRDQKQYSKLIQGFQRGSAQLHFITPEDAEAFNDTPDLGDSDEDELDDSDDVEDDLDDEEQD